MAYVVRSWPRLSQTFVVNEVLALERLGVELVLFSMTDPGERLVQPQVGQVRAQIEYLDAGRGWWPRLAGHARLLLDSPACYLRGLGVALTRPGLVAGYTTSSTLRCFAHAVHVAGRLRAAARTGRPVRHLHAHFAHDPALIGLFTARLTGLPFSLTAHARDLYQLAVPALAARAKAAGTLVVCCRANAVYLHDVLPPAHRGNLRVLHHGVDLELFHPVPRPARATPVIVSVGRLVAKKGFAELLIACAALRDDGVAFRCMVYGDGPLCARLLAQRDRLGLADHVRFAGERHQAELVPALQDADVFALLPFVTEDGDRDGVPNVLVEAMACGLPVVATAAGGVPELVRPGENGLLAAPHDVAAVARHLATLLHDAALRRRLGATARRHVVAAYDVCSAAAELAALFAGTAAPREGPVAGRVR
ncbi:MAG TPA: glycosyltransferase family 4 protein [Pseudonocardia sp.]|nr:glycosyltransferase family 4 protein [Pseudonocardia sp.]